MAGKETSGLEHADGDLFRGRTWCIVPPPGADPNAEATVIQLAQDTGACTLRIGAAAHDRAVAAVSHLPFTAAAAIARAIISRPDFTAIAPIAGTGLRDMTRLASADPVMHRDIVFTNRDNIINEVERYVDSLQGVLSLLRRLPGPDDASDDPATAELGRFFVELKEARDTWLRGHAVTDNTSCSSTDRQGGLD